MLARKWLDANVSFFLTEANGLPNALIYLDKWPDVSPDVLYLFSFQLLINQEVVKWYWFVRLPSFCNQGPSSATFELPDLRSVKMAVCEYGLLLQRITQKQIVSTAQHWHISSPSVDPANTSIEFELHLLPLDEWRYVVMLWTPITNYL